MKLFVITLGTLLLLISFAGCSDPEVPADLYSIGDTGPAVGLIFYVDSDDVDPVSQWGGSGMECGDTLTAIGTGEANTLALIGHTHGSTSGDVTHTAALRVYYSDVIPNEEEKLAVFQHSGTEADVLTYNGGSVNLFSA